MNKWTCRKEAELARIFKTFSNWDLTVDLERPTNNLM